MARNSAVKYLNTVTTFSVIIAAFLFFFCLLAAFLIGTKFQQKIDAQFSTIQTQK